MVDDLLRMGGDRVALDTWLESPLSADASTEDDHAKVMRMIGLG